MEKKVSLIRDYFNSEIEAINHLDEEKIAIVFKTLNDALIRGNKIYTLGNGGSGSTASHMANDFNKAVFNDIDSVFDVKCLNDNVALLSAVANDVDYSAVFEYQLRNRLLPNDIVVAFSGSGNSKNVINAVKYAKSVGAVVIGFTGFDGGELKKLADYSLDSNINNMQITEDIHLMLEHLMISMFYQKYGTREYKTLTLER